MDELFLQIERVLMLSDMVAEKVTDYQQDKKDYKRWDEETPEDEKYRWYPYRNRTNATEVKRVMLVARQEMIRLEKML